MRFGFFCLSLLAVRLAAAGDTALPLVSPMFGDHMVVQRDKPARFWGWAKSGDSIRLELAGATATAVAGADGRWQAEIKPPAPGGPYMITIEAPGEVVVLHDVLVGDVWLCGGQSNMELGLARTENGEAEIKAADHPEIRLFKVHSHVSYSPAKIPNGSWKTCTPPSVSEDGGFSAVAYYFGKRLQNELHVPIGLIEDCLGGTPVESWMGPEAVRKSGDFAAPLAEIDKLRAQGGPAYGSFLMQWLDEYDMGAKSNWNAADFNDSNWKTVEIPCGFAELGVPDSPSVCWFRREITLPDPLPRGNAVLFLGSIEKMDTAYINGHWVGASSWVENPRAYLVPSGVLEPGRNIVAVRVFKMKPEGGFLAKPEGLRLVLGDKSSIPLAGEWKGALSVDARPPHPLPLTFENYPTMPIVLYEGMIEPLAPLSLHGVIWYQGEANFERAHQYRKLLPAMIADWRKLFQQGDFSFYIVGLPRFMPHRDQPGNDAWAELREAQALTASQVNNCAVVVTVDTGEAGNIHPRDKRIVGERVANCALGREFGKSVPTEGPAFERMKRLPGALQLYFTHTDWATANAAGKLAEFSVAGKDRKWHWAHAVMDGNFILVSSPDVPDPVAARYAWQANPVATLFDQAGLPLAPFRTDDWPGITDHHKPW